MYIATCLVQYISKNNNKFDNNNNNKKYNKIIVYRNSY